MSKFIILLIILIGLSKNQQQSPYCIDNQYYCRRCDSRGELCMVCQYEEILIPDEYGGCTLAKKCELGKNYCDECDSDKVLCKECSQSYYPDENGGCSYVEHCLLSYRGDCLYCSNDYILVGPTDGLHFCKSLESDDFTNCFSINYEKGKCEQCRSGYNLNSGDKKCIETKNCYESIYGKCIECNKGYYLDHKDGNKCKKFSDEDANKKLEHCKETEDGENCTKCDDDYFFDEEGKCVITNNCKSSRGFYCSECSEGYYLDEMGEGCSSTENCYRTNKATGGCLTCAGLSYLDINDGRQCKSNREDDDLKFCIYFTDRCTACDIDYYLDKQSKCTSARHCVKSEFGICSECEEKFYLDKDYRCTVTEKCIRSNIFHHCTECEEGYVYNVTSTLCVQTNKSEDLEIFENCKFTDNFGKKCAECKDDYYLIQNANETICYSNEEEGPLYKCALSDINETECLKCVPGYFLGSKDKRCSSLTNCAVLDLDSDEEGDRCLECDVNFCLDVNKGTCGNNEMIDDLDHKMYYKCLKTNKKGDSCEECKEGFTVGKNGLCMDMESCEEEGDDGVCTKCKDNEDSPFGYCLNEDYGCILYMKNKLCVRCDKSLYINSCTECIDGYVLAQSESWDGTNECYPEEK